MENETKTTEQPHNNNAKQCCSEVTEELPHSVEISINAKGNYSGKVKVYAATPEEAMLQAKAKAEELHSLIKQKNDGNDS